MILKDIQRCPDDVITVPDDDTAEDLLFELGLLDQVKKKIALSPLGTLVLTHSRHPTHWIIGAHFSGCKNKEDDGFLVVCLPKSSTSAEEANRQVQILVEREGGSMSPSSWQRFDSNNEGRN